METAEVGIIGAGIHGVSASFHLAREGVRARLFERGAPASGPTGRSSAICRGFYTNEFLAAVAHESIEMFQAFHELTGGDAGFHETGILFLHPLADEEVLRRSVESLGRIGTSIRLYDSAALASEFAGFALDGIAFGAWEERAGYADPVGTTSSLFRAAVRLGMRPSLYTEVTGIEPRSRSGAIVVTSGGERVECERLLIAAGPWTKPLARGVGAALPLTVERHIVATLGWGAAPRLGFGHADLVNGYYMKPEGEQLFILGPLHPAAEVDPDMFDQRISEAEVAQLPGRPHRPLVRPGRELVAPWHLPDAPSIPSRRPHLQHAALGLSGPDPGAGPPCAGRDPQLLSRVRLRREDDRSATPPAPDDPLPPASQNRRDRPHRSPDR